MSSLPHSPAELTKIYQARFDKRDAYRDSVWKVLTRSYFSRFVPPDNAVLDLGCGYGEFINNIKCGRKYGMDLNPMSKSCLNSDVIFLEQDCCKPWAIPSSSLDVVFTSNFLEHLPDKRTLFDTVAEAYRCLKPSGRLIAMGPNIKYTNGSYWDFYDHYLALTELSLKEVLELRGFRVDRAIGRFLPYTMVNGPRYPLFMLSLYLRLSVLWNAFGKQFLVFATKL
jgi:SAM-dependent methyltransferase